MPQRQESPCRPCMGSNKNGEQCKRNASCVLGCMRFCWQHVTDMRGGSYQVGVRCTEPPNLDTLENTYARNRQRTRNSTFMQNYFKKYATNIEEQPSGQVDCSIRALNMFFTNTTVNKRKLELVRSAVTPFIEDNEGIYLQEFFEIAEPIIGLKHQLVMIYTKPNVSKKWTISQEMNERALMEDYNKHKWLKHYTSKLGLRNALNRMKPNRFYVRVLVSYDKKELYNHCLVIKRRVKDGMWFFQDGRSEEAERNTSVSNMPDYYIKVAVFALLPANADDSVLFLDKP